MRLVVVILLAIVAVGAAGVWALGEFGRAFTGGSAEARAPLVIEPEIIAANDSAPATPAAANDAPALQSTPVEPAPPPPPPAAADDIPAPEDSLASEESAPPPAAAPPEPVLAERFGTGAPRSAAPPPAAEAEPAPPPPPPPPPAAPVDAPVAAPAAAQPEPTATIAAAAAPSSGLQSQFKARKVTYNRPPTKLALNKPTDISLIIDTAGDANAAERIADLPGTIVERDVELSDFVAAELIGADFDIQLQTTAARQKLSPKFANEWRWRVTPTAVGTRTLTLTIYGYATGSLDAEPLAAYRDEIVVEVQQLDQIIDWARGVQPVFGVLAALAGAASALFAFLRFREEKKRGKVS